MPGYAARSAAVRRNAETLPRAALMGCRWAQRRTAEWVFQHGDDHEPDTDGHEPDSDSHKPDSDGHKPDCDGYKPARSPNGVRRSSSTMQRPSSGRPSPEVPTDDDDHYNLDANTKPTMMATSPPLIRPKGSPEPL
ncbi:MAG: hypothetical protein M1826_007330 [Phylliscum demangeonii]|nr:MAG: hypothetical protein M1826_007330 [Phylliscum demangeonii]